MRLTLGGVVVGVSIRPAAASDQSTIDRWASLVADHMSRTGPYTEDADRHDPNSGLYWYMIAEGERDVGTVWVELPSGASEAVLGVFLGGPSHFGRGIGTAAVTLAVAEFRSAHPEVPIALRVRCSNARAIACYRRVGFTIAGSGSKRLPSGEAIPYYRMVLPAC
jgi:RimJ/RimL family protein N-acetyltransferase